MNPTCDVLEQRVAALEGGVAALALASGQSASSRSRSRTSAVQATISSVPQTFMAEPGTCLPTRSGPWASRCASSIRPTRRASASATDDRTRCYYAETLPNPKLQVFPIAEVAGIGRPLGVPLIMDNTAAPLLCRPFDHGAAVIVYSTTKYIGGHGTSIGGLLVDGGNFDWEAARSDRFPKLNKPDPSYHGAVWTEAVKPLGPDRLHPAARGSPCCATSARR